MSRHQARNAAFCMLYQLVEGGNNWTMAEKTLYFSGVKGEDRDFAVSLVQGAYARRFELEQYIAMFSGDRWSYDRLFSVDKVLLQLSMYEMKYEDSTPVPVTINEAVGMARVYGTDDSAAFVNAVLDGFRQKVLEQDMPEYQINWDELARREEELALDTELKAAALAAVEQEELAKQAAEKQRFASTPIADEMGKKSFRKISRAERTEADVIKPEVEDELDEFMPRAYRRWETDEQRIQAAEAARERRSERRDNNNDGRDGRDSFNRKPEDRKPVDRKFGDKKFGDKKFDGKKFDGERKFDNKKFDGERKSGDRKFGDKKFGDKKFDGERKSGDRKFGDKKFGDKKKFDNRKKFDNKKFENRKFEK